MAVTPTSAAGIGLSLMRQGKVVALMVGRLGARDVLDAAEPDEVAIRTNGRQSVKSPSTGGRLLLIGSLDGLRGHTLDAIVTTDRLTGDGAVCVWPALMHRRGSLITVES